MEQIILINREDISKIDAELKSSFTRDILLQCGLPVDDVWPEGKVELEVSDRIKLKDLLRKYEVDIIDNFSEGLDIYIEKELVGKWKRLKYELCTDMSVLKPLDRVYAKIYIDIWSIFDQQEEENL